MRRPTPLQSERGAVAGLEGVMFGVLVLVAGTLLVVNAWSVLQARRTLDGAAREYLRAYTEADDPLNAAADGRRALDAVLTGERHGAAMSHVVVISPDPGLFGPCALSTVELTSTVPAVTLPFVGTLATTRVHVLHTDLVDAHREMRSGSAYDPTATPCDE